MSFRSFWMEDWKEGMSVTGRMPQRTFSRDSFGMDVSEFTKHGRSDSKNAEKSAKFMV